MLLLFASNHEASNYIETMKKMNKFTPHAHKVRATEISKRLI